jgi:hypothetical protein
VALITVAQARIHLPDVKSGTAEDAIITDMIADADAIMARWCAFPAPDGAVTPTLEEATYIQHLDGPMFIEDRENDRLGSFRTADGTVLELSVRPMTAITEIRDDPDRAFPASTIVAAADYELDEQRARVYLLPGSTHGSWSTNRRSVRVTFTAGFATVPNDLRRIAQLTVRYLWDLRFVQGRLTVVRDGGAETRRDEQVLPTHVRQLLQPYRLSSRMIG